MYSELDSVTMTTTAEAETAERAAKAPPKDRMAHIKALRRAHTAQTKAQERLDQADEKVRQMIKDGFDMGISGTQLAEASGLSRPRVYQIRDGR